MKKFILINLFIAALAIISGCSKDDDPEPETPATPPAAEQVKTPAFSVENGTYSEPFNVEITCATENATIYYTTDGTEPNDSTSTIYSEAITISSTTTIKARAYKENFTESAIATADYIINLDKVATPIFSPESGNYTEEKYIEILCNTEGATIRYTTNGEDPNESNSAIYTMPIYIYSTTTFKAIAYKEGFEPSDIATAEYVLTLGKVETPVFSIAEGTYTSQQNVEITCGTPDAEIRYTLNGTEPDENSLLYQTQLIVRKTITIKAKAFKQGREPSDINSATYTIEISCDGTINIKGEDYTITEATKNSSPFATVLTFRTMAQNPYVTITFKDSILPTGTFTFGENNNYCSGLVNYSVNNVAADYIFSEGTLTIEYDETNSIYTISFPEIQAATAGTGHQLLLTLSMTYNGTL